MNEPAPTRIVTSSLSSIVDRHEREDLFSGCALVARDDTILLHEARGWAHRGFSVPNTVDMRFDTASLGKLFTAAAAFRLADRGLLSLDERILDIVPLEGTKIPRDITVRHCLTHTSGIADDADEEAGEDYEEIWKTRPCYRVRKCADYLPQFVYKEPVFPPGTASRYNNCAYVLLGLTMEVRSGFSFREVVRREVIGPAVLSRTGYFAKDSTEPGIAEGYATVEGPRGKAAGFRKNIYAFPPIGSPDAGVLTTPGDLEKLFRAIEGKDFLSPDSRRDFLAPRVDAFGLPDGGLRRYGHCLEFDYDPAGRLVRYGKDGVNPGVAAISMRYPDTGGFIAILANQDADVWALCRELAAAAGFTAIPAAG